MMTLVIFGYLGAFAGRFLLSPKAGILWLLTIYSMTPQYLGIGVGSGGFALSAKRLIVAAAFGMIVLLFLRGKLGGTTKSIPPVMTPFLTGLAILFLSPVVSSLLYTTGIYFVFSLAEQMMLIVIAFFAAYVLAQYEDGDYKLILYAFIIPLVIIFFVSFVETVMQKPFLNILGDLRDSGIKIAKDRSRLDGNIYVRDGTYRISGMTDSPLHLGEFLCYVLAGLVYLYFTRHLKPLVFGLLLVICAYCAYRTGSRGGQVIFILAGLLILTLHIRWVGISRRLVFGTIVAVFLTFVLSVIFYRVATFEVIEVLYTMDRGERSLYSRFRQYIQVFEIAQESPFFGLGVYRHPFFDLNRGLTSIDNHYLAIILTSGFVGLFTFWFMIYYVLRTSTVYAFSATDNAKRYLGFWVMTTAACFIFLKIVLYHADNNFYFYLVSFYFLFRVAQDQRAIMSGAAPASPKEQTAIAALARGQVRQ